MAVSDEEIAHALELFDDVGPLTTRKMFGGLGIYCEGTIFAIIMSDGAIRLKGAGDMITEFEALGMEPWIYQRPGQKQSSMPYWTIPDSAHDDPEEASSLARKALSYL